MPNTQRIANLIADYLRNRHSDAPGRRIVQKLIETLFYASLRTEEARGVSCTVVFLGSEVDPHQSDQSGRRSHRYVYMPLARPVALTARALAKFSQAAQPWASSIAVRERNDRLEICGLFDQEIHYQNALNREGEARFPRPGLFQVEIAGTGILTVYVDRKLLAKLSQESLVTVFHDVLNEGPIANRLLQYVDKLERKARRELKRILKRQDATPLLLDAPLLWLQTLSRILLGIRRLKHGGAVLLIPSAPTKDLAINFPISYQRTETLLERHLIASARWRAARNRMRTEYSEPASAIPAALVQERRSAFNDREDAKKGELGCAAFISSLAGVDGLILLTGGLHVLGFGVEIKLRKDPVRVQRAGNALASPSRLKPLSLNEFGTRHRSMMRYCDRHPGSIGFIISQDGDIRAVIKTDRGLLLWENIQLQEVDAEQPRQNRSQRRAIRRRCEEIEKQLQWSLLYSEVQKAQGIKRQAWLSRNGDPLKLSIDTKTADSLSKLQIFFDRRGDVLLVIIRNEQQLHNGETKVEEITRYFQFQRLIEMTRKVARFKAGEKITMEHIRVTRVGLPPIWEAEMRSDMRSDAFRQQSEETFRRLLSRKQSRGDRSAIPQGDSRRFRFIEGTSSSDGRLALGLGLAQPIVRWKTLEADPDEVLRRPRYYVESDHPDDLIRNYVVDLSTNKILGETNCHFMGTRKGYGHRRCQTIWSLNNRYLVQLFQGKWATIEATITRIDQKHLVAFDLIKPACKHAYQFLSRRKDRAFRRFGTRFAVSIFCDEVSNSGLLRLEVFGEIPKSAEEDSTFSLIARFRVLSSARGISLRFIDCRFAPRQY
jgi:hypothetical protein